MDVIVDISFSLKTHNAYHLSQGEELTETTQSIKTEDEYNSDRAPLLAKKDISSNTDEFVPMGIVKMNFNSPFQIFSRNFIKEVHLYQWGRKGKYQWKQIKYRQKKKKKAHQKTKQISQI